MNNSCCEIVLEDSGGYVVPWVQVSMMNWMRVRSGKPPYTDQQINELLERLNNEAKNNG